MTALALLLTVFQWTAPLHDAQTILVNGVPTGDPFGRPGNTVEKGPLTEEVHYVERRFHPDPSTIDSLTGKPYWLEEGTERVPQAFTNVAPGAPMLWNDGGLLMYGTIWLISVDAAGNRSVPSNYAPSRVP